MVSDIIRLARGDGCGPQGQLIARRKIARLRQLKDSSERDGEKS